MPSQTHNRTAPRTGEPSARLHTGERPAAPPQALQVLRAVYPLNAGLPHWIDFPRDER